ncbi:MAG: sulfite exporter TauE/SafE family protein [Lawsonibacter sp.]|nr:sulfite exporter TauE/SafE family protein [Lawsonibacter sp.]
MTAWLLPLAAGAATGVLSGFGVGGGTLLLVYMTALAGVDQHLAQGINLLYFLPAGLLALPAHVKNGYVERQALLPAIGAGLACAALAAWWATSLDVGLLRKIFGGFLLLIGLWELFGPRPGNGPGSPA